MSSYQPNPPDPLQDFGRRSAGSFDEHHAVETPEQIRLQFTVAGIGSRFLAIAIDSLIQILAGGIAGVAFFAIAVSWGATLSRTAGLWFAAGAIFFYFALYFGYFVLFEIFWNGQTPGKRSIGIRVIKDSGRPLNAVEVIGRNLMRIVDQLPSFYVVGIITALCNGQSKRLGDFVAGSIVVQDRGMKDSGRSWEQLPVRIETPVFIGVKQMPLEEIALIDAFLARRNDLELGTRHRMASEIVERIGRTVVISREHRQYPERTLEVINHEYRQN